MTGNVACLQSRQYDAVKVRLYPGRVLKCPVQRSELAALVAWIFSGLIASYGSMSFLDRAASG